MKAARILKKDKVTHDVFRIVTERPEGYSFNPGQAAMVALDIDGWKDKKRPFTFTSLMSEKHLEFMIKSYPFDGVTAKMQKVQEGESFLIGDAWGTIDYKGPGMFIAGGAGITPFLAILRSLDGSDEQGLNKLIFSNKTSDDVIAKDELKEMLGNNSIFTLTREASKGFLHGRIDKDLLLNYMDNKEYCFYVCGPPRFNVTVKGILDQIGIRPDDVVLEM